MQFALTIRGQELEVDLTADTAPYRLRAGESLTIFHGEKELCLSLNMPVSMTCNSVGEGSYHTPVESKAYGTSSATGVS